MFVALAMLVGNLITAPSASAATPLTALPRQTYDKFRLKTTDAVWADLKNAVAAVERTKTVTKVSPLSVAQSAQHRGSPDPCHPTKLNSRYIPDGFCWDRTDDTTSNYDSEQGGWMPQGLTASHDATPGGTYNGHHLYLASWFHGVDGSKDEYARVSIVENNNRTVSYGHVFLVTPTDNGSFMPTPNIHADGMVWYGKRLFVANGGELLVYDMRHLWKVNTISGEVGVKGASSSARWHQWAMPLIGRYWTGTADANPRKCTPGTGEVVCLSSLSLDRQGAKTDTLVSGEFRTDKAGGRIIRWPLNAAMALPRADDGSQIGSTKAWSAYTTPVWSMQGVAADGNGRFYMAGRCPDGWSDVPASSPLAYSCIHYAKPGDEPHVFTMAPRLTQNLSWAPQWGRLWGLNESINPSSGDRVVFSIDVSP
ncbi:hypothetical protein JJV70_21290 [Streptomyces sp. JJ66]|uniref:hypothetical protein n=1 Tax=Streptomyces sp. JJ66 TaxID=2803843 RepID=UPI001C59732B|nr:hypothetical protein [Streptomyces sp. JJ66]MBW1604589.1 hypothetical protein [Streptomyces sp. JJ66]